MSGQQTCMKIVGSQVIPINERRNGHSYRASFRRFKRRQYNRRPPAGLGIDRPSTVLRLQEAVTIIGMVLLEVFNSPQPPDQPTIVRVRSSLVMARAFAAHHIGVATGPEERVPTADVEGVRRGGAANCASVCQAHFFDRCAASCHVARNGVRQRPSRSVAPPAFSGQKNVATSSSVP